MIATQLGPDYWEAFEEAFREALRLHARKHRLIVSEELLATSFRRAKGASKRKRFAR